MAGTTIDRVQVEIEATARGVSTVFTQLEQQMTTLKNALAAIDTSKLSAATRIANNSGMSKTEREISSSVDRIKQSFASLKAYKDAALSGDSSSLTSFSRKVINLQSQIDALSEKMQQAGNTKTGLSIDSDSLQTYRDSLAEVQSLLNAATSDVAAFQAQQNQGSSGDLEETKSNLSGISIKAKDVISAFKKMASGIKSALSSVKSKLSEIKDRLTSIGNSTSKTFGSGLTTILKYGFGIRSLYVLFRRLRQAIKDSFTELQNSGADYETTRANIEALKNSLTTLKYQFGAAFEPIFNTVAPALQTLINYLVSVMNTLSAFIAKLTGKNTYSKAVVATSKVAENTGSAAGSAKELNKQLQGFDELNNLTQNNGSSGGGGSGGSSDASNVTYEEASVDGALSSFWSSLAESIEAGDWKSVGSKISEKLTSAMNDIKWDDIYNKASSFGTNLANFLNGLITTDLFSALGTTIAGSLNTALSSLNSFGETFDWTNLGNSIASGINSFVTTFDLGLATDTFNKWANGILDALISAVGGVDFKNIASKVSDGIEKIDASGIGWKVGKLIDSLVDALYDLLSNKSTWTNLGTKIADGINGFFEGFDGSSLAKTANAIKDALFDTVKTAVKKINWTEIGNDIVSFLGDLDIGTITLIIGGVLIGTGAAGTLLSMASTAIIGQLSALTMATMGISLGTLAVNVAGVAIAAAAAFKIGWQFGTTAGEFIAQLMKNAGIISDEANEDYYTIAESMTMMEKINDIKLSVKEGTFATAWTNMWGDWFDPTFAEIEELGVKIKSLALELVDGWNNTNDQIWDPVFELGEDIWEGIKDAFTKVIDWASPIKEMFDNIVQKIKDKFGIHSPADSMKTYGEQIFNGIIEGFKSMFSGDSIKNMISTLYTNIVNKIKEKFQNFKLSSIVQGLGDFAVTVTSTFKGAITKLADWSGLNTTLSNIKSKYQNMKAKLTTTMDGVAKTLDDIPSLKDKFNELKETWTDKASKLKAEVGGQLSKVADIDTWKTKFTNLKTAWTNKDATMKASVGGQIKNIDELSTNSGTSWKDKFETLKNAWVDKSNTMSTKVGGQISSIDTLSTSKGSWKEKINDLKSAWADKSAEFKATEDSKAPKDSINKGDYKYAKDNWKAQTANFTTTQSTKAVNDSISSGDYKKAKDNWKAQTAEFKTTANTKEVTNAEASGGAYATAKSLWQGTTAEFKTKANTNDITYSLNQNKDGCLYKLKNDWSNTTAWAKFTGYTDLKDVKYSYSNPGGEFYKFWDEWRNTTTAATFTADFSYDESAMSNMVKKIKSYFETNLKISFKLNQTSDGKYTMSMDYSALGGSYYNNAWHSIPQYASGGKPNHGSLFVAGEAGPEIVGHMNGRTEVLNKSQIASTIHSAFVSSMAQFGNRMLASPESVAIQSGSYSSFNTSANGDGQTAMLAEQNRLLAEQNELLREIASKDVSISSRDVFNAVKSESKRYNNMTGSSPFLF